MTFGKSSGQILEKRYSSVSSFYVTSFDKVDNQRCSFQFRNILLLVKTTQGLNGKNLISNSTLNSLKKKKMKFVQAI